MEDKKRSNSTTSTQPATSHSHRRLTTILVSFIIFMFAFTYLLVPIFTFVCQRVGINGKNAMIANSASDAVKTDYSRRIKIQFVTSKHGSFDFIFKPLQAYITIHPGERKTIYFYAENSAGKEQTIQAVPSITPIDAARFLKKIECFCFTQQHFKKHEKAKMFVNFYIDPDIDKNIKEMTLSYVVFESENNINAMTAKGRIKSV